MLYSAAIAVKMPEHGEEKYVAVMAAAKKRLNLADCGIDTVRTNKAKTGALLREILGPEDTSKCEKRRNFFKNFVLNSN